MPYDLIPPKTPPETWACSRHPDRVFDSWNELEEHVAREHGPVRLNVSGA